MSILNLGFQSIGLMRRQAEEDLELIISKCNNMKQMRAAAAKEPTLADAVRDSMEPVKILISDIICCLQLKGRSFEVFSAASELEIEELCNSLHAIDSTLSLGDKHRKVSLSSHPSLKAFLSHCCQEWHYSFCIKKCGDSTCDICKPPRLPPGIFLQVHHLRTQCQLLMAITNHSVKFMVHQQLRPTTLLPQSILVRPRHSLSLPVFNMCRMCPWWYNVKSVQCGGYCMHPESSPLLPGKNSNHFWKTTLSHVVLLWEWFRASFCPQWGLCSWLAVLWPSGKIVLFHELWSDMYILLCRRESSN